MSGGRRWGVVLGAGGVLGGAWQVGALAALEEHVGADLRAADVLVGTSVGALHAALVASGVAVADLEAHQRGEDVPHGPLAGLPWDYDKAVEGAYRLQPFAGVGSPRLLREVLRPGGALPRTMLLASLAPVGRGSLHRLADLLDHVVDGPWPSHPDLRIAAVDYDTGRRSLFDRARGTPVARAVVASCAVPGMFPPVPVDGHRYVDGGVWSTTNADVLGGDALDEVWVLAPLAVLTPARTRGVRGAVAGRWRRAMTRRTLREAAALREAGTRVTVLGPGAEDLALMGSDLMDPTGRLDVLRTGRRTAALALARPRPLRPAEL